MSSCQEKTRGGSGSRKKKKRNTCRTIEDVLGSVLSILGFVSGSRGFIYIYIEYMDFYFEIIKRNYWIF